MKLNDDADTLFSFVIFQMNVTDFSINNVSFSLKTRMSHKNSCVS